ncbi:hypothetical protein ACFSRY_17720 [Pontibacter locisalis]|uniref:Uncharacterized protein n=1 Tax=Pontibacter locisalis TaxID=1719035 RepID=A0ABW5IQ76_9BACT
MATTRLLTLLIFSFFLSTLTSCKTCPISSCHVRMVHAHGEDEFRGQPIWKKQNPKIGEKLPKRSQEKRAPRSTKSKNKN